MKQDQKKYKQDRVAGATTATPGIPHELEAPRAYKPHPSPCNKPMRYEWIEIIGLALLYLFIIVSLKNVPASGSKRYYDSLLSGRATMTEPEGRRATGSQTAGEGAVPNTAGDPQAQPQGT